MGTKFEFIYPVLDKGGRFHFGSIQYKCLFKSSFLDLIVASSTSTNMSDDFEKINFEDVEKNAMVIAMALYFYSV